MRPSEVSLETTRLPALICQEVPSKAVPVLKEYAPALFSPSYTRMPRPDLDGRLPIAVVARVMSPPIEITPCWVVTLKTRMEGVTPEVPSRIAIAPERMKLRSPRPSNLPEDVKPPVRSSKFGMMRFWPVEPTEPTRSVPSEPPEAILNVPVPSGPETMTGAAIVPDQRESPARKRRPPSRNTPPLLLFVEKPLTLLSRRTTPLS